MAYCHRGNNHPISYNGHPLSVKRHPISVVTFILQCDSLSYQQQNANYVSCNRHSIILAPTMHPASSNGHPVNGNNHPVTLPAVTVSYQCGSHHPTNAIMLTAVSCNHHPIIVAVIIFLAIMFTLSLATIVLSSVQRPSCQW